MSIQIKHNRETAKLSTTPRTESSEMDNPTRKALEEVVYSTNLAKTMNESLWVGDKDDLTVHVNPSFEKLTGYSLQEATGKHYLSFFDEECHKTIKRHCKLRKLGLPSQYEATIITKTGEHIPLLISGSPSKHGGTIGVFTNLSTLVSLTQEKKISEQIIRHSTSAIVVLNKNRQIKMWNTGATRIFGYKEAEVQNAIIDIIIPPEEKEANDMIREEVEKFKFIKNYETKRLHKNGTLVDVALSVTKVTDEKGKFIGYLLIYRDIGERKKVGTELQKRFEAIQDAYKELGLQKRQNDYIYEIVDMATSKASLENLANLIVSAASMLTKCDGAVLRLLENTHEKLRLHSCFGVGKQWLTKNKIDLENSIAKDAFATGRGLIVHNVDTDERHQGRNLLKLRGFKTLILLPLVVEGELIGSLSLYANDPAKFRMIETDFLEKFGKQCALALFIKTKK